jgi:hypothetical protein
MDDTTMPSRSEPTDRAEQDAEVTDRIDELEAADPAEAPALAEPLADELARALDGTGGPGTGEDEADPK